MRSLSISGMRLPNLKRFLLFILFIAFTAFSSSGDNNDSLLKTEEIARQKAIEALKKLEATGANGQKTSNMGQHTLDSLVAIKRIQDSLKKDSLMQKAKYEKNKKIHNLEKSLNAYANKGFTIYDGIIYFTLFVILFVVFLYFRKLYKNKNLVFKEFFKLWKQKFKELRDKEKEIEKENIIKKIK